MSILKNLNVPTDMQDETNRQPMSGLPRVFESDVYDMVIDTAYLDASASGAISVNFVFKAQDGRELKSTQYITSGQAKGCLPYYERDGKRIPLPGYSVANAICLLTIGEEISTLETETKMVSIYDYAKRKEVPQQKEVIMELLGQPITLGVLQVIEDKRAKASNGNYEPTGETRTINEIDKVFRHDDKLTTPEVRDGVTEAGFYDTWIESNRGKTRNKAKGAVEGATPASATAEPSASAEPAKSMFKR